MVARLMGFLASRGSLFPSLARLLLTACPPVTGKCQHVSMSVPEALVSNLAVRFLSLKRFPEVAAQQASLAKLLCVPLLWSRCPVVLLNVSPGHCSPSQLLLLAQLNIPASGNHMIPKRLSLSPKNMYITFFR